MKRSAKFLTEKQKEYILDDYTGKRGQKLKYVELFDVAMHQVDLLVGFKPRAVPRTRNKTGQFVKVSPIIPQNNEGDVQLLRKHIVSLKAQVDVCHQTIEKQNHLLNTLRDILNEEEPV